jgi:hypothetical protein
MTGPNLNRFEGLKPGPGFMYYGGGEWPELSEVLTGVEHRFIAALTKLCKEHGVILRGSDYGVSILFTGSVEVPSQRGSGETKMYDFSNSVTIRETIIDWDDQTKMFLTPSERETLDRVRTRGEL